MRTARHDAAMFLELCAQLLGEGRCVRFHAAGTSMVPTIRDGDLLTVDPVGSGGVRPGDIILFHQARRPLVHRVAEVRTTAGRRSVIARGDGKRGDDGPIDERQILGKVVAIEPRTYSRLMLIGRAVTARLRRAARLIGYGTRRSRAAPVARPIRDA